MRYTFCTEAVLSCCPSLVEEIMTKLWLVQVEGDVSPVLHGPYESDEARIVAAKELLEEDAGTCFRLNVEAPDNTTVGIEVDSFSSVEIDSDDDDDE